MQVFVKAENREYRRGDGNLDKSRSWVRYPDPKLEHGCFREYRINWNDRVGKYVFGEISYDTGSAVGVGGVNYCPKCGMYFEYHYTEPETGVFPTGRPGKGY